ncbi:LOW QUALITY PROTEIN: peptidyl-tRNA hydrolase [Athene noctua]|uniref:LOW QUALITY PROTEIN: peptidyl-tRNA hydrolase n=1 Tax=Athene noctua TaxID=126797 RepID=UPI003EBB63BF
MLAAELAGRARPLLRRAGPRVMVAGLGNYGLRGTRHSVGMEVLDRLARQLAVAEGWRVDRRCCADMALAVARGLELVLLKPRRLMNLNGLSIASAADIYNLLPEDIYLVHDDLDKAQGTVAIKLGGSASLAVFSAPASALGSIPAAEATAGCLGGIPVPALAGSARSLLEASVGWIQPISCTTWAFYSTVSALPAPAPAPGGHNGVRSCISALNSNEMTRLRIGIGRPEGEVTVSSYVLAPFHAGERERLEQVLAQAATCLLEHILQRRAPTGDPGDRG